MNKQDRDNLTVNAVTSETLVWKKGCRLLQLRASIHLFIQPISIDKTKLITALRALFTKLLHQVLTGGVLP